MKKHLKVFKEILTQGIILLSLGTIVGLVITLIFTIEWWKVGQ
ncbi:hypothetical protein [Lactobacillus sp. PV037]|nr:hypothetical protein [Lactobacillus sp. PV037]